MFKLNDNYSTLTPEGILPILEKNKFFKNKTKIIENTLLFMQIKRGARHRIEHLPCRRVYFLCGPIGSGNAILDPLRDDQDRAEGLNFVKVKHGHPQGGNRVENRWRVACPRRIVCLETGLGHGRVGRVDGERLGCDGLYQTDHVGHELRGPRADINVDICRALLVLRLRKVFDPFEIAIVKQLAC